MGESLDSENNLAMEGRLKIVPEVAAHFGEILICLSQSRLYFWSKIRKAEPLVGIPEKDR